jgi:hypothetical protein
VQFVEFRQDGFVLQMTQPFIHGSGRAALGDCMVEVTEIVCDNPAAAQSYSQELTTRTTAEILLDSTANRLEASATELPLETPTTLVEAIETYYNQYIAGGRYAEAWRMVSDQYKTDTGALTLDQFRAGWELTGPAILLSWEATRVEVDEATFILELDYRKVGAIYKVQYDFIRDKQLGHAHFDYWLFDKGTELERNFTRRRTEE